MRRWLPLAMAALLALTLLPGLAAVDALDEREARDLVTAFESTNHREWLSPIYGYEPFFEKPLPGYAPEVLTRRLLVLADGPFPAGRHSVDWTSSARVHLGPGLYFVRFSVPGRSFVQRFALVR